MNFLNPFSSIADMFKLIVLIACLAVGGYGTYKASHFVSDYYATKQVAAEKTRIANEQAIAAEKKRLADIATAAADNVNIHHDDGIVSAHDAQKQEVNKKADAMRKTPHPTTPTAQKNAGDSSSLDTPVTPDAPVTTDATDTAVSTLYITTLWSNYCEASGSTGAQCKAAT